jgi:hypothetical protein
VSGKVLKKSLNFCKTSGGYPDNYSIVVKNNSEQHDTAVFYEITTKIKLLTPIT